MAEVIAESLALGLRIGFVIAGAIVPPLARYAIVADLFDL